MKKVAAIHDPPLPTEPPALIKHSSESVEHYTPPWVIEGARDLMGDIDLDPASSAFVNTHHVRASRFFSKEDDGLAQPWSGRVFLNPPGGKVRGKSLAGIFWAKLVESYERGDVTQAVFLAYSLEIFQTSQRRDCVPPYLFPFCVPRTRVRFYIRAGNTFQEGTSPPNASAIVYLPPDPDTHGAAAPATKLITRFVSIFSTIGEVRR